MPKARAVYATYGHPNAARDNVEAVRRLIADDLQITHVRAIIGFSNLYFPVGDARFEAQFIPTVSFVPIPSLWGHPAGAGGNLTDRAFLNEHISRFLAVP